MILVNVKSTYPAVAAALADHDPRPGTTPTLGIANIGKLIDITRGDWQQLSAKYLNQYADYVAATTGSTIVGVFRVDGVEDNSTKTRFLLSPAPETAHLLGAPMPGGAWKRGEGRGTRGVTTPRGLLPTEDLTSKDVDTYYGRLRSVAAAFVAGRMEQAGAGLSPTPYSAEDTSFDESATLGGAHIRAYPDGTVAVTAPRDVRVMVSYD